MFWSSYFKISHFSTPGLRVKLSNGVETWAPRAQKSLKKRIKPNQTATKQVGNVFWWCFDNIHSQSLAECTISCIFCTTKHIGPNRPRSAPMGSDLVPIGPNQSNWPQFTPIDTAHLPTLRNTCFVSHMQQLISDMLKIFHKVGLLAFGLCWTVLVAIGPGFGGRGWPGDERWVIVCMFRVLWYVLLYFSVLCCTLLYVFNTVLCFALLRSAVLCCVLLSLCVRLMLWCVEVVWCVLLYVFVLCCTLRYFFFALRCVLSCCALTD